MSEQGLEFWTGEEEVFDIQALLSGAKRFERPQ